MEEVKQCGGKNYRLPSASATGLSVSDIFHSRKNTEQHHQLEEGCECVRDVGDIDGP